MIDYTWDFNYLSIHPNLDLEIVSKFRHKPWNWSYISYHPRLSPEQLDKYQDLPITIEGLCSNINITLEYLKKIENRMSLNDWMILSCNPFKHDLDNQYLDYGYQEWRFLETILQVNKFKEELMIKTWNPNRLKNWCLDITENLDNFL